MTRATWSSRRLCGRKAALATLSRIDAALVRAGDALVEVGRQPVELVAREGRVRREQAREVGVVERRARIVGRVVEVGAGVERDAAVGERRVGVLEVALVLRDLARRVEVVDLAAAHVDRHAVGDVRAPDGRPLLELDDDGGVAGGRVLAGDQDVEALRGERQLELDEDALLAEVAELEDLGHRAERVLPGADLGQARLVAELLEEPLGELVREPRLHGVRDELLAGALVEVHVPSPGSTTGRSIRR